MTTNCCWSGRPVRGQSVKLPWLAVAGVGWPWLALAGLAWPGLAWPWLAVPGLRCRCLASPDRASPAAARAPHAPCLPYGLALAREAAEGGAGDMAWLADADRALALAKKSGNATICLSVSRLLKRHKAQRPRELAASAAAKLTLSSEAPRQGAQHGVRRLHTRSRR